ncbi:unnamed protein product [Orchesella dallaii]|uniref:CRAL-TRIO domain-containing protein n=1 Tax=Orchesella dallaii TaxID=48710 RepID=A0ABP1PYH3_9HEXA
MIRVETPQEESALQKFRDLVKDLNKDEMTDVLLLRFLRARDSPEKAETQLRKALKWREDCKIDSYLYWRPSKPVEEDLCFKYTGPDKEGRPVYWVPIGRWHVRQFLEQGYREDIQKMKYHILEYITGNTTKLGQHQSVIIFGIEHLAYSQVLHLESMQLMFASFRDLEQYYPETIKTMYIVNTPWFFPYVMNILRPLLSPRTSNKLKIYNGDKPTWLAALRTSIPDKSIPAEYLRD